MESRYLKVIVISVIYFIEISCTKERSIKIDEKMVITLARDSVNLPSRFTPTVFFGRCNNSKKALVNIYDLRYIHEHYYKNLSFLSYLDQVFNQKISLDGNKRANCFSLNPEVEGYYYRSEFDDFLSQYCIKFNGKEFKIKQEVSKEKHNSIMYFLFINNYMSYFDDITGYTYFIPFESLYEGG